MHLLICNHYPNGSFVVLTATALSSLQCSSYLGKKKKTSTELSSKHIARSKATELPVRGESGIFVLKNRRNSIQKFKPH